MDDTESQQIHQAVMQIAGIFDQYNKFTNPANVQKQLEQIILRQRNLASLDVQSNDPG